MKKTILFLYPKGLQDGQPAKQRIDSFREFYANNNCTIVICEMPMKLREKIKLIQFIYQKKIRNIFVSMPPFRGWFLFALPFVDVILDIRDGWSIAIKSGYGGTAKPSTLKAYIASWFEKFGINRAALVITCTKGLQSYLEDLTSKNILLITNGYSKQDFEIVQQLKQQTKNDSNRSFDIAVCVGQFAEYGAEKAKTILSKINRANKKTIVKLIGSNKEKNSWILDWIQIEDLANIDLQILPRMSHADMYGEIFKADYGISVIRDPHYDFGTKVFDYILCHKPIFDYFDDSNNFVNFFEKQLNSSNELDFDVGFLREELIWREKKLLLGCLR